jgi:uncharacterized membrane protein (UPF0127 family)
VEKNTTTFFGEVFWGYLKAITVIFLLIVICWSWFNVYVYTTYFSYKKTPVVIKNTVLAGYVADTEASRIEGLSGKYFLPSNTSMLFMFDKPDIYGIWMKDMNFPLDIVWLDKDKMVVHSLSNVNPSTYPHVFYPSKSALYVLELRAGFLEEKGVKTGDLIYFDK